MATVIRQSYQTYAKSAFHKSPLGCAVGITTNILHNVSCSNKHCSVKLFLTQLMP